MNDSSRGTLKRGMKRNNTLYFVIGILVIGLGALGLFLYQERHKSGIEIELNDNGLFVGTH